MTAAQTKELLPGEQQMTAAQTNEHEEKYTGIRTEKMTHVGSKTQEQENRTEGVHINSNKASCLCYKAEPGTLSAIFLLSSTTVSSVTAAAVEPPLREQINEKQPKLPGLGAVATQVPLICRNGTLPHDLLFYFCIRRQQYQYG